MIGALFSHFASRGGFSPLAAGEGVGGGPVGGPPANGRAVFHVTRRRRGPISALIRRAFSAQLADEPAGDGPAARDLPDSDCWPMEVCTGEFLRHGGDHVGNPTLLSPGKFPLLTAGVER